MDPGAGKPLQSVLFHGGAHDSSSVNGYFEFLSVTGKGHSSVSPGTMNMSVGLAHSLLLSQGAGLIKTTAQVWNSRNPIQILIRIFKNIKDWQGVGGVTRKAGWGFEGQLDKDEQTHVRTEVTTNL